jgi:hypothetical protein
MSDLAQYRLTSRAVVERATLQRDAGRIEPKDFDLVASTAAGLDGILDTFDTRVSTDRSLYRDDLLPGRVRDAATTARAAMKTYEGKADKAAADATSYAARIERFVPDGRGSFTERQPQPFNALDTAKVAHLWGRFATQDPLDLRVRYLAEMAKPEPDPVIVYALEHLPEVEIVTDDVREQARQARARALRLDAVLAGMQATAAAMRLLIDEAHRVVDAIAGVPPSAFRTASDVDISSTIL